MSTASSIVNSLRNTPTSLATEHHISLLDEEQTQADQQRDDAELEDREASEPTASTEPLKKRVLQRSPSSIQQSVRRQWTKQKYARYDRDRYNIDEDPPLAPDHPSAEPTQVGEDTSHVQTNYLERSRAKAKSFLKRKGTLGQRRNERDTVIDILYENQRGMFFFGIPKYSSSSLLPSDPNAWLNAQFRASPVDIRDAQVPDPSWEWAWKTWYVDMSRDVDEEGWEYSFQFSGRFAWHGNHPWFHSFVRRRRWLRMRRRRDAHHHTKEAAHEFTPEYFTIHPKTILTDGEGHIRGGSGEVGRRLQGTTGDDDDWEKLDITDIASLVYVVKQAAVDREKLAAVRKFVDTADDELYYLSERMPQIMDMFIFQSSRQQLLSQLLHRSSMAHGRRESLKDHQHDDEDAQKEHDLAAKRAEYLVKAVQAAEEQVKKLEYWSDIKDLTRGAQAPSDVATTSSAFASKQDANEGAPVLHRHPEHGPVHKKNDDAASVVTALSKRSGNSVVAVKHPASKDSSTEVDGYVTAAESASEMPGKPNVRGTGKSQFSTLDGVSENATDVGENPAPATPSRRPPDTPSRRSGKLNVSIVEPVAEPMEHGEPGSGGNAEHS